MKLFKDMKNGDIESVEKELENGVDLTIKDKNGAMAINLLMDFFSYERSKNKEMMLKDGYWVDTRNNKWDANKYTKKQAKKFSDTLINCSDCIDCENCTSCIRCTNCKHCKYYVDSSNCDGRKIKFHNR